MVPTTNVTDGRRHQVLLDFDGLLIDMAPFTEELNQGTGAQRWIRFFAHTPEAAPVREGLDLVSALRRIRWRYAISTTRPAAVAARGPDTGRVVARQLPPIRAWTKRHLPLQPTAVLLRHDHASAAACKREHFWATATTPRHRPAALFVDDDPAIVEQLAPQLPAVHLRELTGLCDADLMATLRDSSATADRLHRHHATHPEPDAPAPPGG
jgi:hypothetical protein